MVMVMSPSMRMLVFFMHMFVVMLMFF